MPKQFSLRLLLVFVTALCIVLGVWGSRAERQRRAVKAIEAAGGTASYNSREPLQPWLRDYFADVSDARLSIDGTDEVMAHLKTLPKLRNVWLDDTPITDEGSFDRLQRALPRCKIYWHTTPPGSNQRAWTSSVTDWPPSLPFPKTVKATTSP